MTYTAKTLGKLGALRESAKTDIDEGFREVAMQMDSARDSDGFSDGSSHLTGTREPHKSGTHWQSKSAYDIDLERLLNQLDSLQSSQQPGPTHQRPSSVPRSFAKLYERSDMASNMDAGEQPTELWTLED